MTTFRNRLNNATQTNGTDVTTTNFALSGDGLGAAPQKTGTSTCKYDTALAAPMAGSAWISCAPQAGFQSTFYVTITPSNDATWETVFYYPGAPTVANTPFVYARTSTDTRIGEFCCGTNGKPNFQASGGGQIAVWTGTALTVGAKRLRVKVHTHATAGTVDWYVYKVSDGTLEASGSASGVNIASGSQIGRWLHGNNSATYAVAGNWAAWEYSLLQWADTYTDLGPFPTSTASASAGPDWLIDAFQGWQSGDGLAARATVDGSQSTWTGSGSPTIAWTAPGGSGITFVDSTALVTQAIIPCALTDQTYTLTLTITINGVVGTDTANVTVKGAEYAVPSGGAWKPSRVVQF